jgi:hypothetical protein
LTVVFRHSGELEINRVDYVGAVTMAELNALADYQSNDSDWLTYDSVSVVAPGTAFVGISQSGLNALFAKYKAIYERLNFVVLRRSCWMCDSPAAQDLVTYWLTGNDPLNDLSSDARQFWSFEAAGEWLMLKPGESPKLENGESFREIARFAFPEMQARALAS